MPLDPACLVARAKELCMLTVVVSDPMMIRLLPALQAAVSAPVAWRTVAVNDPGLLAALADADVFVGARLTPAMIAAAPRLQLVQVSGAGIEQIALEALPPGVRVANTFHHERSIAEYVMMAALVLSRRLLAADAHLRHGVWDSVFHAPTIAPSPTLRGQTMGILGFGHIGIEVARLARSFEMHVLGTKRTPDPALAAIHGLERLGGPDDLPWLLRNSDVLLVAAPLTAETHALLGRHELQLMKPSAFLINVARAALVDEAALYTALAQRTIAGAALDVWYHYPSDGAAALPARYPFHELDNVLMTPHTSGSTTETFERRAQAIAANISRLLAGDALQHVVARP